MRIIQKLVSTFHKPIKKKRVAAYARVSTGKDSMQHSLSAQVSYFSEYIQSHAGWEYMGVFADNAFTGTKDSRPEFQRMLDECRAGNIDMIITKSISRFARNTLTLLETVRELKTLDIDVFFQEQNIHSISGDGEFMLTILAAFAQEESRSVSENCKWRIQNDFKKGLATPHRIMGFEYKKGKLIPKPDEADTVRMIFNDYLSGMGSLLISRKLKNMGININRNSVMKLLKNEKYIGDMLLQKSYKTDSITKIKKTNHGEMPMYHVKDSHPAIIDRETHSQVQEELQKRINHFGQTSRIPAVYAFTKMIRCGLCQAPYHRKIVGTSANSKKPVWICSTFNTEGKAACASQQVPESILEAKTAEALGLSVFDEASMKQQIREIQVPSHNLLLFVFHDATTKTLGWENPSRRESWTPEMKEKARQTTKERNETTI
ncbi:hypothetical protein FACS1894184_18400 [Clostridia bacterium]|nr:hypothetical protein FACS1894184_18400 [Clostridia bacterium]